MKEIQLTLNLKFKIPEKNLNINGVLMGSALKNDFFDFSTKLANYWKFSLGRILGKTYIRTYDNIIMDLEGINLETL